MESRRARGSNSLGWGRLAHPHMAAPPTSLGGGQGRPGHTKPGKLEDVKALVGGLWHCLNPGREGGDSDYEAHTSPNSP